MGTASASTPIGHFPTIKFWNSYKVVTMDVPERAWCPKTEPYCEWQLFVDEPDIPSQTVVGTATGTSGILTVHYPKNFCGVIQADAIVGPSPWLYQFGHRKMIKNGSCNTTTTTTLRPPPTTTTTLRPPPRTTTTRPCICTTTTKPKSHPKTTTTTTTTANSLPFTSTSSPPAVVGNQDVSTTTTKAVAELPFTGADVRPLVLIGSALIVMGIYILTTLEQRRRTMRRMATSMRTSAAAGYATRTSRWFLGD
ncbi:MAG: hypothetical protein ABSC41_13695 [Acidimicrobiales bacterium]